MCRLGEPGQIHRDRQIRIVKLQVAGLILVVVGIGEIDRRGQIEGNLAIGRRIGDLGRFPGRPQAGVIGATITQRIRHPAKEQPMFGECQAASHERAEPGQPRAEVPRPPKLSHDPGILDCRDIVLARSSGPLLAHHDRLRGKHPGLHGRVDTLDLQAIEKAGFAAD